MDEIDEIADDLEEACKKLPGYRTEEGNLEFGPQQSSILKLNRVDINYLNNEN